jgi:hypothetical protein
MKAPWWHRVIQLVVLLIVTESGLMLGLFYHFGVMLTYAALLYGAICLAMSLFYPQLASLSPLLVWEVSPEKLARKRKIMLGVSIGFLLAGFYGVFALLTGMGAPYE